MNHVADRGAGPTWAVALAVVLVVLLVYGVVLRGEFSRYDDRFNVTENPRLAQLTAVNLRRIWSEPYGGLYVPATYTWFAAESWISRHLPGRGAAEPFDSRVFHGGNLLLHAICTVWVLALLRQQGYSVAGAAFGALVFGLHPLQAESVAWVTESKGLLAGALGLAGVWLWRRGAGDDTSGGGRAAIRGLAASGLFGLALLAKPSAVVLPVVALVLGAGGGRRVTRAMLVWLVGWLLLAGLAAWGAKQEQPDAPVAPVSLTLSERLLVAADATGWYVTKFAAPGRLAPDYGRTPARVLEAKWREGLWLWPVVIALALVWRPLRWLGGPAGVSLTALAPTLGLVSFAHQEISTVADRYAYLALLGPAWGVACLLTARRGRGWLWGVVALTAVWGGLAHWQARAWRDDRSLFAHTLAVNPRSLTARVNLGMALADEGALAEAESHFRQALRIAPTDVEARFNLVAALYRAGRLDEALAECDALLAAGGDKPEAYYLRGDVLRARGDTADAVAAYRAGLERAPESVNAANNLAWILATAGDASLRRPDEAIAWAERACAASPRARADLLDTLAAAYAAAGRFEEAARTAARGVVLAREAGQTADAEEIDWRRRQYASKRAYIEGP